MSKWLFNARLILCTCFAFIVTQVAVVAAPCAKSPGEIFADLKLPIYAWQADSNVPPKAIVVALHGGCLHGRAYNTLGTALAARNYLTVSLDMRGYGRWYYEGFGSKKDRTFQYKQSLADVGQVLTRLRGAYPTTPIYCLGESLGANMAISASVQNPQCSDGIIAVSPFAAPRLWVSPRMALNAVQVAVNPASKINLKPYFKTRLGTDPVAVQEHLQDPLSRDKQSVREIAKSLLFNYSGKRAAKKLGTAMPILIVTGSKDKLCSSRAVKRLYSRLNCLDKELIVLKGQGHLLVETSQTKPYLLNMISEWIQEKGQTRLALQRAALNWKSSRPRANGKAYAQVIPIQAHSSARLN